MTAVIEGCLAEEIIEGKIDHNGTLISKLSNVLAVELTYLFDANNLTSHGTAIYAAGTATTYAVFQGGTSKILTFYSTGGTVVTGTVHVRFLGRL